MNKPPNDMEQDLALLLDVSDNSAERRAAEHRCVVDPAFNQAYVSFQAMAAALDALGSALSDRAENVDILADVQNSIHHLTWESGQADDSSYASVDYALSHLGDTWGDQVPVVNLKPSVMEAVAASQRSDSELDVSFLPVATALHALGDELASSAPQVDIVSAVMGQVASKLDVPVNVVPLRARPAVAQAVVPGRRSRVSIYAAVAAAVLCVAGSWWAYQYKMNATPNELIASNSLATIPDNPLLTATDPYRSIARYSGEGGVNSGVPGVMEASAPDAPTRTGVRNDTADAITLQEAINARRRTLVNDLAAFEQLASLSTEEASQLLQDMDLSLEALLGAAQFLSPEDAAGVLRAAITNDPENERLKFALAKSLADNPDLADDRQRQLEDLSALNQENSLPQYMLAVDFMGRGETERGLDALSRGAERASATPYTLERMREREAILRASGVEPDVARYLAVATAGEAEASDIASLRSELLNYGSYYEELGDYETAEQIYDAVKQLGVQITEGADMALVQRAGLETQQDAMYAIRGIAEILQKPENVELLGGAIGLLADSISEVTQYVTAAQTVIDDPEASSTDWSALVEHIMLNGDLDIANLLTP